MHLNYNLRILNIFRSTKVRPYDLYPNSNLDPSHNIVARSFHQKLQDMHSLPFLLLRMSLRRLLSGGTKVRPYDLYPNSNLDPNHSIVAQSFQQKLQDMQSLPFPRRNMSLGYIIRRWPQSILLGRYRLRCCRYLRFDKDSGYIGLWEAQGHMMLDKNL